jgi:hypothetical protein
MLDSLQVVSYNSSIAMRLAITNRLLANGLCPQQHCRAEAFFVSTPHAVDILVKEV